MLIPPLFLCMNCNASSPWIVRRSPSTHHPAMKKLLLACIVISCASVSHASSVASIYQQGMIAVRDGNVNAAEAAFKEVLRLQPGHANARYQLAELKQNQGSIAARARAKKLGEAVIGQIDFSKTEFSDAIAALGLLVEKRPLESLRRIS